MKEKENKSSKTPLLVAILVLVLIILAALCVVYFGMKHYVGRTNYVSDEDVTINYDLLTLGEDETVEGFSQMETLASMAESVFVEQIGAGEEIDIAATGDVYNILLIGTDTRSTWHGNSDSMILISINYKKKTIYMTSFMRDLYANIPGVGIRKLNSAYAVGGGPLLVATLENNYRIDIDNYAAVNFGAMSTLIDMVGGVDINVTTAEAPYLNRYLREVCGLQHIDPAPYYVTGGGMTHLNGVQAVSFARIRYANRGNEHSDYGRTSRQREVLNQIFTKVKSMGATSLIGVINEALPLITHNIDTGTLAGLITKAPEIVSFTIQNDRIPYAGLYTTLGEELVPDFQATINRLHSTIYGE